MVASSSVRTTACSGRHRQTGGGVEQAVEISLSRWRLEPVSATFHGRDIFAPVAAHLAAGEPLDEAGDPLDPSGLVGSRRRGPGPRAVLWSRLVNNTDRFGNVQLAAAHEDLTGLGLQFGDPVRVRLESGEFYQATYGRTFSDVDDGELLVFEDSGRMLALALNRGSAVARLGLRSGDELRISHRARAVTSTRQPKGAPAPHRVDQHRRA